MCVDVLGFLSVRICYMLILMCWCVVVDLLVSNVLICGVILGVFCCSVVWCCVCDVGLDLYMLYRCIMLVRLVRLLFLLIVCGLMGVRFLCFFGGSLLCVFLLIVDVEVGGRLLIVVMILLFVVIMLFWYMIFLLVVMFE